MNTLKLVVWCSSVSVQIQLNYLCDYCSWLHLNVREQLKYFNTISLTLTKSVFHFLLSEMWTSMILMCCDSTLRLTTTWHWR
jgi:hypothetical protein